jgi:hypothetical protein
MKNAISINNFIVSVFILTTVTLPVSDRAGCVSIYGTCQNLLSLIVIPSEI